MKSSFISYFTILFSIAAGSTTSFAQSPTLGIQMAALQAALDARNQNIELLKKGDVQEIATTALQTAVVVLSQEILVQTGDLEMSNEALTLGSLPLAPNDIGDFEPLVPQIEEFLVKLEKKYGAIVALIPYVKEVRMLNFALKVIITPKNGAWKMKTRIDPRIEYRKHFIPVANLVTYYGSFYACQDFLKKQGQANPKKLCDKAAEQLKFLMGRYVAPIISDWIFRVANQRASGNVRVTERQIKIQTADELRKALEKNYGYSFEGGL